jgi:hypothetical protein
VFVGREDKVVMEEQEGVFEKNKEVLLEEEGRGRRRMRKCYCRRWW